MARLRSFDQDAGLDSATGLFWRHGFVAMSLRELGTALLPGLPSLYARSLADPRGCFLVPSALAPAAEGAQ